MGVLLNDLDKVISIDRLTGHFHDTEGTALSLVEVCLNSGMNTFHGSINGLGGCPFSNKIVGNLSTEKLIDYLHLRGYNTGIDVTKLNKIKILDKNETKLFGQSGVGC
jgi:hydroxymethylglutaryl-CoA lyase